LNNLKRNNIMNKEVNFNLAKLLKEKGYANYSSSLYLESGKFRENIGNYNGVDDIHYISYSAPTIADVIMWLYETHNIWIEVSREYDKDKYLYQYFIDKNSQEFGFKTPIKAYEAAIEYTLNNLI